MKRALPIVPLVFFFLFVNACGIPPDQLPNILNQTLIATSWTPTFTPTASRFNSLLFVNTLSTPLPEDYELKNAQELEYEIGAEYDIVDAELMHENNLPNQVLEVRVNCFCHADSRDCCSPERTFVIVMRRMEEFRDSILWMVPDTVAELRVYCMDHDNRVGTLEADWADVLNYLSGRISAKQFGIRVRSE
jgi:hypothetical protein